MTTKERAPRTKKFTTAAIAEMADSVESIAKRARALSDKLSAVNFNGELTVDGGEALLKNLRYAFKLIADIDREYELTLLTGIKGASQPDKPVKRKKPEKP